MTLYHGSNVEIEKVDLDRCRPFKDFGKGFYTTPILEQAWAMAKRTARIYKSGRPCVTEFVFDEAVLEDTQFSIKRFAKPDSNWARFVINNRNRHFTDSSVPECNIDNKYDLVIGPVANDDISALIDVYLAGILSDEALTQELTFRELSEQVSFHAEKAVRCLKKTGASYA
ncbi:MAG: DUF3990 domain-containing protein [Treponema sp.]|jgi:hypothetical protein|nr:DUF3990 domain-containing protein [Treponema sp.]